MSCLSTIRLNIYICKHTDIHTYVILFILIFHKDSEININIQKTTNKNIINHCQKCKQQKKKKKQHKGKQNVFLLTLTDATMNCVSFFGFSSFFSTTGQNTIEQLKDTFPPKPKSTIFRKKGHIPCFFSYNFNYVVFHLSASKSFFFTYILKKA